MLRIFNDLEPFFRDNYRRINVREYARAMKISPPTASKRLLALHEEGLLQQETERNFIFYHGCRENPVFLHLSRIYWLMQLERAGVIKKIEEESVDPLIVLFGSFSKAEVNKASDIDLAVFSPSKRELNMSGMEKKLGRKIHLIAMQKKESAENFELLNNIFNGFILRGAW